MSHEIVEIKETRNLHVFHCEKCGKKIMESMEYDDGWYEEPDWINESIFIHANNERYIYQAGFFCKDCLKKATDELVDKLISIGFKDEHGTRK